MEESKIDTLIHARVNCRKKQDGLDRYLHVITKVEFSIDRQLCFIVHDRTIHSHFTLQLWNEPNIAPVFKHLTLGENAGGTPEKLY